MAHKYPYLNDQDFLLSILKIKNQTQYAKVTVLTFDEKPIKDIQGDLISGNINIDGKSAVRRTCNLSLIYKEDKVDLSPNKNLFSINKKVNVEIGFNNTTNLYKDYPIIWFPLGIYVISNSDYSHSINGVNLSLQLKDKMCLLNGDCGGILPASVTFHEIEKVDTNGKYYIDKPTIYQIILELVNHWGNEQLGKIIISDIDDRIKQTMKWIGDSPVYVAESSSKEFKISMEYFEGAKSYSKNMDIGFIYTDFTYPGELIGNAGQSVCDILETIKNTLGNYEYFYDIDGNFHFQEIKNYLNTSKSTTDLKNLSNSDYLIDMSKGKSVFVFNDAELILSYSNSPQFNMIKNDFLVWGVRKDASDISFPIRYHLAIDDKPKQMPEYDVFFYTDPIDKIRKAKVPQLYSSKEDFPTVGQVGICYAVIGEKQGYIWDGDLKSYKELPESKKHIIPKDWRTVLYLQGVEAEPLGTSYNDYYTELINEWPKIYDIEKGEFKEIMNTPSDLDFFLDFIDSAASISEFSISNIGKRSKVIVDDSINCVFEPDVPDVILLHSGDPDIERQREECDKKNQAYYQVDDNIYYNIAGGGYYNSAYNLVRELLYEYTSYNESVNIQCIPLYFLEPNTRISIIDKNTGINGDYMINSISIPLNIGGTMNISCIRALDRI